MFGILVAGQFERDLRAVILDVLDILHDQQPALQVDLARLGIDVGQDVGLLAVARTRRLANGIGHRLDDDLAVDRFLARHGIGDLQQFKPVCTDSHLSSSPRLFNCGRSGRLIVIRVNWRDAAPCRALAPRG